MTQKKLGKLTNVYTRGDMQPNDKNRYFFIRTYLPKDAIEEFVNVTSAYAFIEHNAEECEKHFHLLCKFENARTLLSVGKTFFALSKKYAVGGAEQSTFVEIPTNKSTAFDYLTHSDRKSKKQGKHQYSNTEVECDNVSAFKEESTIQDTTSAVDILDDTNKGVSFREMAQKYGKGFVIQYSKYKDYASAMRDEEEALKDFIEPTEDFQVHDTLFFYHRLMSDEPITHNDHKGRDLVQAVIEDVAFLYHKHPYRSVDSLRDESEFIEALEMAVSEYRKKVAEFSIYVKDSCESQVFENLESDEVLAK